MCLNRFLVLKVVSDSVSVQGADLVFGGWSSWSWHSDHIGQVTYCKQLPMLAALVILIIFWV